MLHMHALAQQVPHRQRICNTVYAPRVWTEEEESTGHLQPVIEDVNKEVAVEEVTGKEVTPEEAPIEAVALEEVPVMHVPPCLEELVWANLQELHKLRESSERCKHFEYRLLEEMHKFVTLKGREVASAQGNVTPVGVAQGNVMVG